MSPQDPPAPDEPQEASALVVLTELGRDAAQPYTIAELHQGLATVRMRLAVGDAQRRSRRRWAMRGALAAACVVAALKIASVAREHGPAPEPAVVVARIEGGTELEGGYLAQSGAAGVQVLFNEGSLFALSPGARGRLRSVAKDGAHLTVEEGLASFEITQSRTRRWLVEAGPFLVTVKGTVFTVSWDPAEERFELRLRRGRVVVSGPIVNGGIELRAGQRLAVSLPRAETVIADDLPETGADAPVAPAKAAAPSSAAVTATGGRPTLAVSPAYRAKRDPARHWTAALASGDWDRILADVDRDGVDATLQDAGSDDLFALADAARYRRRADLAREALLAERRRFPRAPRSLEALFMLGRVEELREHGTSAQAIAWYDDYLSRAPMGAFAAEALGRKMILTNETAGPDKAGPIAREYLQRFPTGSYAGSARALQRSP